MSAQTSEKPRPRVAVATYLGPESRLWPRTLATPTDNSKRSNAGVIGWCLAGVIGMFGFGFAMVPLYDVMCDALGINGKTNAEAIAYDVSAHHIDKTRLVQVEFVATNNSSIIRSGSMSANGSIVSTSSTGARGCERDAGFIVATVDNANGGNVDSGSTRKVFHKIQPQNPNNTTLDAIFAAFFLSNENDFTNLVGCGDSERSKSENTVDSDDLENLGSFID